MKRILCVFLCVLLLLGLTACRSAGWVKPDSLFSEDTTNPSIEIPSETEQPETEAPPTTEPTETTEATQPSETAAPCAEHSFDEWTVTEEATCAKAGLETRVCTVCGEEETREIPPLEHSYGSWQVTKAAACTANGAQERVCTVCGYRETASIAAIGHSYGDWQVTKAATCTSSGTRTRTCKVCGQTASEAVPAGHNWGDWTVTKQERYPNPGEKERTCTLCGAKETAVYKPTEAEKNAMALAVARQIVAQVNQACGADATDLERVSYAAGIVAAYSQSCYYADDYSDKDYRTPYGVFVKGLYTCSGSTRAMGLVLECMGFQWTHVNENQEAHQWCRLVMDGQVGFADGQVGLVGYGEHPYG